MKTGSPVIMDKPGENTPVPAGTPGEIVNFNPSRGWEIKWETGVSTFFPGNGDELSVAAKPGEEKCDFCPAQEAAWEHRAEDAQNVMLAIQPGQPTQSFGQGSHGSWAACEACHRLIEAGKRDKLARRAAKKMAQGHNLPMKVILQSVRSAHSMYWDGAVGPGIPIRKQPTGVR